METRKALKQVYPASANHFNYKDFSHYSLQVIFPQDVRKPTTVTAFCYTIVYQVKQWQRDGG